MSNLYYPADEPLSEAFVGLYGGICVSVPTGPVVNDPADAGWVLPAKLYPSGACDDCTRGGLPTLCPDDVGLPGADVVPDRYIRKGDLADVPDAFPLGVWCYEKPASATVVIPEGGSIIKPTQITDCDNCGHGIQYQPCEGETPPPSGVTYWAKQRDVASFLDAHPSVDSTVQKIGGRCYTLDLTASMSRIPLENAVTVPPRCAFLTCYDCACGGQLAPSCDDANTEHGWPVQACLGQSISGWPEVYMPDTTAPDGITYGRYKGFCAYVDTTKGRNKIPASAQILYAWEEEYLTCGHCLAGGGGKDPPDGPPPPPPPPPPPGGGEGEDPHPPRKGAGIVSSGARIRVSWGSLNWSARKPTARPAASSRTVRAWACCIRAQQP